jgi:hypothetical protein
VRSMPCACSRTGERGGEPAGAAGQPGQGDRVHVVVVAHDLTVAHLIVLLKEMLASIQDASAGSTDPGLRDRVLAVLTDGLRRPSERAAGTGTAQAR